ncbi:hypothetical protein [Clostridium perfringens]|uniref:hypothetical protein n=1 Tax=Clostridium perfringens TaxID=1502 RepID=UPI0024BD360E|nr:hypothetical protein [Clostridium perfringens]
MINFINMTKYYNKVNLIGIVLVVLLNLYLTYLSIRDDNMLNREKEFKLTNKLLHNNKVNRRIYLLNMIVYSFTFILLLYFEKKHGIFLLISGVMYLGILSLLIKVYKRIIYPTETEERLMVEWVFNITEEINDLKLDQKESEQLYEIKIKELINKKNINISKFNKAMENLSDLFNRIQENK